MIKCKFYPNFASKSPGACIKILLSQKSNLTEFFLPFLKYKFYNSKARENKILLYLVKKTTV